MLPNLFADAATSGLLLGSVVGLLMALGAVVFFVVRRQMIKAREHLLLSKSVQNRRKKAELAGNVVWD